MSEIDYHFQNLPGVLRDVQVPFIITVQGKAFELLGDFNSVKLCPINKIGNSIEMGVKGVDSASRHD